MPSNGLILAQYDILPCNSHEVIFTRLTFTCSKSKKERPEQCEKPVES